MTTPSFVLPPPSRERESEFEEPYVLRGIDLPYGVSLYDLQCGIQHASGGGIAKRQKRMPKKLRPMKQPVDVTMPALVMEPAAVGAIDAGSSIAV